MRSRAYKLLELSVLVAATALAAAPAAADGIDRESAVRALDEFDRLCEQDDGTLWGVSLCGRLMIVDPGTRDAYFNAPPPIAHERIGEGVYAASYPAGSTIANTAIDWEGARWIQLIEVPDDPAERRALLAHEAFHGIQSELGFDVADELNDHLEDEQARLWLRLEAGALAAALNAADGEWQSPLADAMRFNRQRAILYPRSRHKEATLVNHEGLAEYTGVALSGGESAPALAIERLETVSSRPSLVRSIGYVVGPAYGLLLDRLGVDWKRKALDGVPLPALIEDALYESADLRTATAAYGYEAIAREEAERAERRNAQLAELRRRFVEGPVLILPFRKMSISFNPNRIIALEDLGSIRSGATITDSWGRLEVEGDVLIDSRFSSATVPLGLGMGDAMEARRIEGDNWVLTLEEGWRVVPGDRDGDWIVESSE